MQSTTSNRLGAEKLNIPPNVISVWKIRVDISQTLFLKHEPGHLKLSCCQITLKTIRLKDNIYQNILCVEIDGSINGMDRFVRFIDLGKSKSEYGIGNLKGDIFWRLISGRTISVEKILDSRNLRNRFFIYHISRLMYMTQYVFGLL